MNKRRRDLAFIHRLAVTLIILGVSILAFVFAYIIVRYNLIWYGSY